MNHVPDYWRGETTKSYKHSHSNTQTRYLTILQETALLLHSRASFDFLFFSFGQEMFWKANPAVLCQKQRSVINDLNAESAGRSHSEQVIKSWWYDTVSLSTRPVHAAYMRVMQTALRVLFSWYNSQETVISHAQTRVHNNFVFRFLVPNVNREPLYLLRQS